MICLKRDYTLRLRFTTVYLLFLCIYVYSVNEYDGTLTTYFNDRDKKKLNTFFFFLRAYFPLFFSCSYKIKSKIHMSCLLFVYFFSSSSFDISNRLNAYLSLILCVFLHVLNVWFFFFSQVCFVFHTELMGGEKLVGI